MRNRGFFFLLLLCLTTASPALANKIYFVRQVAITADLHDDGSMTVSEQRTYEFKGRYRYAFRTFPRGTGPTATDFSVSESGQPYELSDSEEPGTFRLITRDDEIEVRWYYRARYETRTFDLSYVVPNAVTRHQDAAVLYYKFVGEGFRKRTDQMDITVNPPTSTDKWQVRQWAHGPLWGESATSATGVVTATCRKLPAHKYFELRILYPTEIFNGVTQQDDYVVDGILAEEEAWVAAANARREKAALDAETTAARMKIGAWAMPLLLVVAVAWFIRIALRYGRRPVIESLPQSSPEVPSDLPPAMVQYLVARRSVTGSAMVSTLLDLARRGFVEFGEEQVLGKDWRGREKWTAHNFWRLKRDHFQAHQNDLAPFEASLLKFVFEDLGADPTGDTRVDVAQFKKEKSKVTSFFGKWSREVKSAGKEHGFFASESFRGQTQGLLLGGGLVLVAALAAVFFHQWAVIPGMGGVMLMLLALMIPHHTADGLRQARRWLGLKSYLNARDLERGRDNRLAEVIEAYLVYGAMFGLSKQHMSRLGNMIPAGNGGMAWIPWYTCVGGDGFAAGDSLGSALAAAVSATGSAMSSASGSGGGATGGGGGGAGGGGGGAG